MTLSLITSHPALFLHVSTDADITSASLAVTDDNLSNSWTISSSPVPVWYYPVKKKTVLVCTLNTLPRSRQARKQVKFWLNPNVKAIHLKWRTPSGARPPLVWAKYPLTPLAQSFIQSSTSERLLSATPPTNRLKIRSFQMNKTGLYVCEGSIVWRNNSLRMFATTAVWLQQFHGKTFTTTCLPHTKNQQFSDSHWEQCEKVTDLWLCHVLPPPPPPIFLQAVLFSFCQLPRE